MFLRLRFALVLVPTASEDSNLQSFELEMSGRL